MTGGWRDYPVRERVWGGGWGVQYGVARARAWSRRARWPALAVRAAILLSGLGALVLALPPAARLGPGLVVAALLAYLAAAVPGSFWVSVLELGAVITFVIGLAGDVHPAGLPELALLAALLYLHHSSAALATVLRTDAVVPPAVLRRFAGRGGVVLAASAGTGLCVLAVAGQAAPGWSGTAFVGLGVLGALGVVAALAWLARR